jgi:hypothetical protein
VPAPAKAIGLGDKHRNRAVTVHVGDRLVVRLSTTAWRFQRPPAGLAVVGKPRLDRSGCRRRTGGCGAITQQYRATRTGTFLLTASRTAPRDRWAATLHVRR